MREWQEQQAQLENQNSQLSGTVAAKEQDFSAALTENTALKNKLVYDWLPYFFSLKLKIYKCF